MVSFTFSSKDGKLHFLQNGTNKIILFLSPRA